jgi:hypothetical protein
VSNTPEQALPPLPIVIRAATDKDKAFVLSSWKKSTREYYDGGNGEFYALMNAVCDAVLDADPILFVAHPPDATNLIVGWVCAEATPQGTVLWMQFTKSWARRQRVASRLLDVALQLARDEGAGPLKCYAFGKTRHGATLAHKGWERSSYAKALHLRASGIRDTVSQ